MVPLDVGSEAFIIGAYRFARFGVMGANATSPWRTTSPHSRPERSYDGGRARVQNSAAVLEKTYNWRLRG